MMVMMHIVRVLTIMHPILIQEYVYMYIPRLVAQLIILLGL